MYLSTHLCIYLSVCVSIYLCIYLSTNLIYLSIYLPICLPGFLSSREVTLSNTSEIPMTYHLRVCGDPPTNDLPTRDPPTREKEFDIRPHSGTLPPNLHRTIKVCSFLLSVVLIVPQSVSLPFLHLLLPSSLSFSPHPSPSSLIPPPLSPRSTSLRHQ